MTKSSTTKSEGNQTSRKSKTGDDKHKDESGTKRDKTGTKRDETGTKRDESGTKRDESGSKREYCKEELKRLRESLQKEAAKIQKPQEKEFTPDTFNSLEPYCDLRPAEFLVESPDEIDHSYNNRQTATGICDPWVDLKMDAEPPATKTETRTKNEEQQHSKSKVKDTKENKDRPQKDGSTRLPKYPAVKITTTDLVDPNKPLDFSDVAKLRENLRKKCGTESEKRVSEDYQRTKADFYRMELDKMEEYAPSNRDNMKATYFAYLQNNVGSKKAVHECVRNVEGQSGSTTNRRASTDDEEGQTERRGQDVRGGSSDRGKPSERNTKGKQHHKAQYAK